MVMIRDGITKIQYTRRKSMSETVLPSGALDAAIADSTGLRTTLMALAQIYGIKPVLLTWMASSHHGDALMLSVAIHCSTPSDGVLQFMSAAVVTHTKGAIALERTVAAMDALHFPQHRAHVYLVSAARKCGYSTEVIEATFAKCKGLSSLSKEAVAAETERLKALLQKACAVGGDV
jgi:hypothetical protein